MVIQLKASPGTARQAGTGGIQGRKWRALQKVGGSGRLGLGWDGAQEMPKFGFHEVTAEGAAPQGWCWLFKGREGCRQNYNCNLSSHSCPKWGRNSSKIYVLVTRWFSCHGNSTSYPQGKLISVSTGHTVFRRQALPVILSCVQIVLEQLPEHPYNLQSIRKGQTEEIKRNGILANLISLVMVIEALNRAWQGGKYPHFWGTYILPQSASLQKLNTCNPTSKAMMQSYHLGWDHLRVFHLINCYIWINSLSTTEQFLLFPLKCEKKRLPFGNQLHQQENCNKI